MKNSNTKKLGKLGNKALLVTVDIGKLKHTGYCRSRDGRDLTPFEFSNTTEGFFMFWKRVFKIKSSWDLKDMVIGFESTGPYAEPLLHFLNKRGVRLVQVNPMHTKKIKELCDNSPAKTDWKDPRVIADIIELGHGLTVVIPEKETAELRRLTQARERSVQRRSVLFSQLHDLVFLIFPEFLSIMDDLTTKSAKHLLNNYPRPKDIVDQGEERLGQTLKAVSRGRIKGERARKLYLAAKESAGIKEGEESIVFEMGAIISMIEAIDTLICEFEERVGKYLERVPYSRFILSIKGIAKITTAGIIGEMGGFRHFRTISEVQKHAGLNLYEISSGKHKGEKHITKRGRSLLRKLLFLASINVVRKDGIMHKQYQLHLQKGMPKIKALIAISRKLLALIFALVRDQNDYLEDYAKTNHQFKQAA